MKVVKIFKSFFLRFIILDYVSEKTYGKPFGEMQAKLLCYKLQLGLKKYHGNIIMHNRFDIRNIMFDVNFHYINTFRRCYKVLKNQKLATLNQFKLF